MGNAGISGVLVDHPKARESVAAAARRRTKEERRVKAQNVALGEALEDLAASSGVTLATRALLIEQMLARVRQRPHVHLLSRAVGIVERVLLRLLAPALVDEMHDLIRQAA